tara:strand:- start:485 stop:1297 length:813 start_codon:yes stop_codon:yes gene_type:complete
MSQSEIYTNIHIESTYIIVNEIEKILKTRCDNLLSLEFDFYDVMTQGKSLDDFDIYDIENYSKNPSVILCLFHNEKCISSISCKINALENAIEISSKTNENYQGKKYNLFLRYALVLIISNLYYTFNGMPIKFQKIISRAVNPISILSMAKHFDASNEKLQEYLITNGHDLNPQNLTLEIATQFYDDLREIPSDIEDEDEMMEYYETHIEPYDPVIMEIDLQNIEILNKLMQKIQSIKIICPDNQGGKKRVKSKRKTKRRKPKRRKTKKN